MQRRTWLRATVGGIAVGTAGCLGRIERALSRGTHGLVGGEVTLEASRAQIPVGDPMRFVLRNDRRGSVRVSLHSIQLRVRVDGEWQRIPNHRQDDMGTRAVAPGESMVILVAGHRDDVVWPGSASIKPFGAGEFELAVRVEAGDDTLRDFEGVRRSGITVEGASLRLTPPDVETRLDGDVLSVFDRGDSDDPVAVSYRTTTAESPQPVAPEVLAPRWDLRAVAFLRRESVSSVRVRHRYGYFRTPIEWLQASGAWRGFDRSYTVGDLTFHVEEPA